MLYQHGNSEYALMWKPVIFSSNSETVYYNYIY